MPSSFAPIAIATRNSLLALAAVATTGSALAQDETPAAVDDAPNIRNCLQISGIRRSNVISDQVIVFEARGRKFYKNTLPNRCPRLGFERAFSYQTSITQLCNVDIITVLNNVGGSFILGPSCGLGKFEEISKEDYAALREERRNRRRGKSRPQDDDTAS